MTAPDADVDVAVDAAVDDMTAPVDAAWAVFVRVSVAAAVGMCVMSVRKRAMMRCMTTSVMRRVYAMYAMCVCIYVCVCMLCMLCMHSMYVYVLCVCMYVRDGCVSDTSMRAHIPSMHISQHTYTHTHLHIIHTYIHINTSCSTGASHPYVHILCSVDRALRVSTTHHIHQHMWKLLDENEVCVCVCGGLSCAQRVPPSSCSIMPLMYVCMDCVSVYVCDVCMYGCTLAFLAWGMYMTCLCMCVDVMRLRNTCMACVASAHTAYTTYTHSMYIHSRHVAYVLVSPRMHLIHPPRHHTHHTHNSHRHKHMRNDRHSRACIMCGCMRHMVPCRGQHQHHRGHIYTTCVMRLNACICVYVCVCVCIYILCVCVCAE